MMDQAKTEKPSLLSLITRKATCREIKAALEAGADVNERDDKGYTPLHHAAGVSKLKCVQLLLKYGADVNARDNDDSVPLMFADSVAIAKELLAHGADVNARDRDGCTPLVFAAEGCNYKWMNLYLAAGADINTRDNHGRTILMRVLRTKIIAQGLVEYLVDKGIDVVATNSHGVSTLDYTRIYGSVPIMATPIEEIYEEKGLLKYSLERFRCDLSRDPDYDDLCAAVEKGLDVKKEAVLVSVLDWLLDLDPDYIKMTEYLLLLGADVNMRDELERTPLHNVAACCICNAEQRNIQTHIIRLLSAHGADVNARDEGGKTPLMSLNSNIDAIHILVAHGADVNARDKEGMTPLMHLADCNDQAIVSALIEAGARVGDSDWQGQTVLMHMVRCSAPYNIIKLLIDKGADISARDFHGYTASDIARFCHQPKKIIKLLSK